jgi:hypothetical protein
VNPNDLENATIIGACENGNLGIVKLQINQPGVSITARHNLASRAAAAGGHCEVVEFLLRNPLFDPMDSSPTIPIFSRFHLLLPRDM